MNTPTTPKTDDALVTRTAMRLTIWDHLWRLIVALAVGIGLLLWLVKPYAPMLTMLIIAVYATLCISDRVRRILRNRAGLRFDGGSIQLNGYCGASFRLDGLNRKDILLVQNPFERHFDTGRLLIRKQGIYLQWVKHFHSVIEHVESCMPKED